MNRIPPAAGRAAMPMPSWKFNKRDIVVCAAVVLCALLLGWRLWMAPPAGNTVVISRDGVVVARLSLSTDTVYVIEGTYRNVVRVKAGKVYIESATCPGKDCMHQGAISKTGSSIICLPNHVAVRIEGGSADVIIG